MFLEGEEQEPSLEIGRIQSCMVRLQTYMQRMWVGEDAIFDTSIWSRYNVPGKCIFFLQNYYYTIFP